MKRNLSAIALLLLLATGARAEEATAPSDKANTPTEDCSKQVWPNFTPSCLRNAGQHATNVRLVSTERR
ncbi:hypothetical protein ABIE49_005975 [Bradyrhizobium sp. OAE829]